MFSGMRTLLAIALGFALLFAVSAQAERRVALVVGNGAYDAVSPLANPENDARLMQRVLRQAGFAVTLVLDAGDKTLPKAVIDFGHRLEGADVGLFYYAGHRRLFDFGVAPNIRASTTAGRSETPLVKTTNESAYMVPPPLSSTVKLITKRYFGARSALQSPAHPLTTRSGRMTSELRQHCQSSAYMRSRFWRNSLAL